MPRAEGQYEKLDRVIGALCQETQRRRLRWTQTRQGCFYCSSGEFGISVQIFPQRVELSLVHFLNDVEHQHQVAMAGEREPLHQLAEAITASQPAAAS